MANVITYHIDRANRIERIEGDWSGFARENGGHKVANPDAVIGKHLLGFFDGSEVQSLYSQVFDSVRLTGKYAEIPFRCDAPDLRRYMRLEISRRANAGLSIRSVEIGSEGRAAFDAIRQDAARSDKAAHICSVCRRVHVPDRGWMEAEAAVKQTVMFVHHAKPHLEERVCSDCSTISDGCRYIVTEPPGATGKLPTVLYLHGLSQGERLLRMFAPPRLSTVSTGQDYRLISPVLRKGEVWQTSQIEDIVYEVLERFKIDLRRFSVTGVSIGALAAWNWLLKSVVPVSAFVPISANLVAPLYGQSAARMQNLPVWAFYGAADHSISERRMRRWFEMVKNYSSDAHLTVYDGHDHDAWSRAYSDRELWNWLLDRKFALPSELDA